MREQFLYSFGTASMEETTIGLTQIKIGARVLTVCADEAISGIWATEIGTERSLRFVAE